MFSTIGTAYNLSRDSDIFVLQVKCGSGCFMDVSVPPVLSQTFTLSDR